MVRVLGLLNVPQYNGLEAVVTSVGVERITVYLLGVYKGKMLKIKPENAQPLIRTPEELQSKFEKIQELTAKQIDSSTMSYRVQLKLTGDKHINTVITCYTLATAYMKTFRKRDTSEALDLLFKANRIRLRIGDDHAERTEVFPQLIKEAKTALLEFDGPDVLSPIPSFWPPTSREQDEESMAAVYSALKKRNGTAHVSSDMILHCIRKIHWLNSNFQF